MTNPLIATVQAGLRVIDLGRQLTVGMPQSPNHPQFWHTLPRRHGDAFRADGGSAANDMITTGTHVGTNIDALAHVSHDGKMFGGVDAAEAGRGGKYVELGIHTVAPMICRGVLLDIPRQLGVDSCSGGYEITDGDLQAAAAAQSIAIEPGDVVLIRTGWGKRFDEGLPYVGKESGTPGVGESGAKWLADQGIRAAGSDTIAFECVAPINGHALLPAHRVLLVENGIYIVEALDLEELAQAQVHEFTFILIPLNIFGATGSPVRPLAVVPAGEE